MFLNIASVFNMYFGKSPVFSPANWGKAEFDRFNDFFKTKSVQCIRNFPKKIFQSPTCGNGFVENGEECDCGLSNECKNRCCDPNTCKLQSNAKCGSGNCCDLSTCRLHTTGLQCRSGDGKCDGFSEFCSIDRNSDEIINKKAERWQCDNGQQIDMSLLCNGDRDCKDQSDETITHCFGRKCPGHLFQCR